MNVLQLIQYGSLWGLVFSAVFCAATLILGRLNVEMLLNDYPPDIRARFGPMSAETRRQANLASLPLLVALIAVLVMAFVQLHRMSGELTLGSTFIVAATIFQTWNLVDLVVLDWFILMTLRPRFMILPGTEGMAGYRNYGFHFRKFLNGIVLTLVLSGVVTAIALGVDRFV
jgi:hypothetical protein